VEKGPTLVEARFVSSARLGDLALEGDTSQTYL
jgi:hypothetical protein